MSAIQVNMEVAESAVVVPMSVAVSGVSADMEADTAIVKPFPDYAGPYTVTPTTSQQTLETNDTVMTDDVTVEAIPSQYHDMSGPLAWLGVDAELVTTFTLADKKLSATDFNTWTPSTTAADILATRTAGTFVASDITEYDYYIIWTTTIPVVSDSSATKKALPVFLAAYQVQEIIRRPSSFDNIVAQNFNNSVNVSAAVSNNFFRYYGTTTGTLAYTWNTSYGFYASVTANTLSSATAESPTITVKSPKVSTRCSTTYMSTANAALVDKDKTVIHQSCKVYKVKKPSFMQGVYYEVAKLAGEVNG